MPNRLEPLNLVDFTGGLNLRKNQFQLAPNESPEMRNVITDPLGGIASRRGWERWNVDDIVDTETTEWDPQRATLHNLSDGSVIAYIAANNQIFWATEEGEFAPLASMVAEADTHMADWATWGDTMLFALGHTHPMWRRDRNTNPVSLIPGGSATWNDDYTAPEGGVGPQAEFIEAHAGYLFAAYTQEEGFAHPNRVRWSHPNTPYDWASEDFIDISIGGSRITALMSFEDHLLIFKSDSVWALYGYSTESWQLVQKSSTSGAVNVKSVTRSEEAVFYYSKSDRGAIYAYSGERPGEISVQLRDPLRGVIRPDLIWVGWYSRRLWVTIPWHYGGPTDDDAGVFVFDPSVGNGAWTFFDSSVGALGPLMAGSNVDSRPFPLAVMRTVPCVVELVKIDDAYDHIYMDHVLGTNTGAYVVTDGDAEIVLVGDFNKQPFDTAYRTPWLTADWPTRKKSWRRPDFVCRETGYTHQLQVRSYRDYEESQPKRQYALQIPSTGASARWGAFNWGDGTQWGAGKEGASIRRGSSFGMCRAIQLRIAGMTPTKRWGIDEITMKVVLRRFR